jgi:AcrR family transcriptional regulator
MNPAKSTQEDTPTRIIRATLELIAEKGSDALRTREILQRAGVSNLSAISYHFGSLENLTLCALEKYFEGARQIFSGIDLQSEPRSALLDFCRKMTHFILENPSLERNIVYLAISGEHPNPIFAKIADQNLQVLTHLFMHAHKDPDPQNSRYQAVILASSIIYPLLLARYGPTSAGINSLDEQERENYFANLVDTLLQK